MNLTNDELAMLEKLGAVGLKISDCATMLEKDLPTFKKVMHDKDSAAYKAYCKGYLSSMIKLRESVLELALRGSGASQKMMQDIISKTDIDTE